MNLKSLAIKQLTLLVMTIFFGHGQTMAMGNAIEDKDGIALWSYLGAESPSMPILYHKKDGTALPASFGVEHYQGKGYLQEQIAKNFWKQYCGECDSMHIRIFYCVLLNEDLGIEEIRFQRAGLVDKFIAELDKCGYFNALEKEIGKTKGKWVRKEKTNRHVPTFVYFGWVEL